MSTLIKTFVCGIVYSIALCSMNMALRIDCTIDGDNWVLAKFCFPCCRSLSSVNMKN